MRRGLSKHGDAPPGRLAFMFNWDAFVLLRPVVADRDVQGACLEFARAHAPRLAADPDVREAFSLHLINLAEHCLLSGGAVKQCLAAVAAAEGGGGAGGDAGALKWLPAAAAGGGPAKVVTTRAGVILRKQLLEESAMSTFPKESVEIA